MREALRDDRHANLLRFRRLVTSTGRRQAAATASVEARAERRGADRARPDTDTSSAPDLASADPGPIVVRQRSRQRRSMSPPSPHPCALASRQPSNSPYKAFVARRAPSINARNFAHAISGCPTRDPRASSCSGRGSVPTCDVRITTLLNLSQFDGGHSRAHTSARVELPIAVA